MSKVIRNGKVAVLYSPGFGAGWYTWNTEHPECIYDPDVVALVEAYKNDDVPVLMKEKYKGDYFYSSGAYQLTIAWIPEGTRFHIHEYDGSESIQFIDDIEMEA